MTDQIDANLYLEARKQVLETLRDSGLEVDEGIALVAGLLVTMCINYGFTRDQLTMAIGSTYDEVIRSMREDKSCH